MDRRVVGYDVALPREGEGLTSRIVVTLNPAPLCRCVICHGKKRVNGRLSHRIEGKAQKWLSCRDLIEAFGWALLRCQPNSRLGMIDPLLKEGTCVAHILKLTPETQSVGLHTGKISSKPQL